MFKKIFVNNNFIGLLLAGTVFLMYSIVLHYKYTHFGYCNWDLALYGQTMWNLLHGQLHVSLSGINFMGDHSDFLTLLLLPFYWITPSSLMLLFLKAFSFSLSVFVLFHYVKRVLGLNEAIVLVFLYALFPPNVFALLYDYNIENHAPIFLLGMWIFYENNDLKKFILVALAACLVKESMPLIVLMFSIHALIFKKTDKFVWSVVPLILGIIAFYILSAVVIPYFRGTPAHAFWLRYAHIGQSPQEVMGHLLNPVVLFSYVFTKVNCSYLLSLFGFTLPFLIWRADVLIIIFPILMYHLLSMHQPEHSIFYHYGLTLSPIIFIALIQSLRKLKKYFKSSRFLVLLIVIFLMGAFNIYTYRNEMFWRVDYHNDNLSKARWAMVNAVLKDAGIIASFDFLAELVRRKHLYAFYKVYADIYQDPNQLHKSEVSQGKPFRVGKEVEYALIDFREPWLEQARSMNEKAVDQRIAFFLKDFTPIKQIGALILFKRK